MTRKWNARLVLLKPDCVQRRLMAKVIGRFEEKGLNIIAMKMLKVTPDLAKQHYAEHVAKPFYPGLEKFITASPILAMVVEGLEVIRVVREMLGATSGLKAAAGTIRGDYSSSRQMNLFTPAMVRKPRPARSIFTSSPKRFCRTRSRLLVG